MSVSAAKAVSAESAETAGNVAGTQRGRGDEFVAELRGKIREAAEAGRRHELETQPRQEDLRRRLRRLCEVVEMRYEDAVRVSEGNIRLEVPATDESGNRTYSLRWIGPGGERWLDIMLNPERLFLQYRWFGNWKAMGVAYTVEPERVDDFDVRELLRRFVDAAPWLAREFPPPLP